MALFSRVFELGIFIYTFNFCYAFPRERIANISRDDIKHKEMLPPDHIAGSHMEHDGDINKDFHHEAFLGTLVKEGKLDFSNMDGYRKLIGIFHKVDKNKDHLLDKVELQEWIHDRILEHYYAAKADSDSVFKKVDIDKDDLIRWYEYKATLVDLDPRKLRDANVSLESDRDGEFAKEVEHWYKADLDGNKYLNSTEFLAFIHPEHNKRTLRAMVEEMMPGFDKNGDKRISFEEFTALPPGEVDPEDAALDREYVAERSREFKEDMDQNGDGFVTMSELERYLDPRHIQHSIREAQYLIRIADKDADSKIGEQEMLTNYALFTGSSLANNARILHDEF
ncbi:45 kDa calcium-binding protein-like [Rhopilema esculentum]|uniref:45 kDa calcium-binding protein-like n=1 Tax=Rhopilema esculentum TaxID=499914 RepID=UPI0031DE17A9|eukprot:gene7109-12761_t